LKKLIFLSFAASLVSSCFNSSNAQTTTSKFPETKPRQNVYIELGGNGLAFTGIYETRLRKASDGVGMKIGLGGFTSDYEKVITAPVALNWLVTKDNKHFFEMGIGATFLHYENRDPWIWPSPQGPYPSYIAGLKVTAKNSVVGNFTMGYRRQPSDGGIMWGVAVTPHLNNNGFWPIWFGVKFGYSFRRS
jgi:hypothetical protein